MEFIWENAPYSGSALNALLALGDWSNHDGYTIFMPRSGAIERLAKRARLKVRGIQYLIRRLEQDGVLIRHESGVGRGNAPVWCIVMDRAKWTLKGATDCTISPDQQGEEVGTPAIINGAAGCTISDGEMVQSQIRNGAKPDPQKVQSEIPEIARSKILIGNDQEPPEHTRRKSSAESARQGSPVSDPNGVFEQAWQCYPKRAGHNPKKAARRAWVATLTRTRQENLAGFSGSALESEMLSGVKRFREFVKDAGDVGTRFVMQASRFFGPDELWRESWETSPAEPGEQVTKLSPGMEKLRQLYQKELNRDGANRND